MPDDGPLTAAPPVLDFSFDAHRWRPTDQAVQWCWADVWRNGNYTQCGQPPDPTSDIGLCAEHREQLAKGERPAPETASVAIGREYDQGVVPSAWIVAPGALQFRDGGAQAEWAQRAVEQMRSPFQDAFRALGDALLRPFQMLTDAVSELVTFSKAAGFIPPDIAGRRHGERWTSPIDGTVWRVCGRRGRPDTFHWSVVRSGGKRRA